MLKSKKTKALTFVLTLGLIGSLFTGCGSSANNQQAAKPASQVIRYNLAAEPKTIDPGMNDSVEGATVDVNAFEGLTDVDANGKVIPGVAEKWDVSADGTQYTFHLRKDAKWSDGKGVTAKDFEYAWKRNLDPVTASPYAYQCFYLKNGEAYNSKKASKDDVGVKATDDYTLQVTLESSTPYFLALMAFPTYFPLRQDIVDAHPTDWATKGDTFVCNGPFQLKEWDVKSKLVFTKNPNYWNKDSIKLDSVEYSVLDQETSYMSAFTSGQLDLIEAPPTEQIPTLLKSGTAKIYPYLGSYYYAFNVSSAGDKVLKDVRVRKAISLAIDRKTIVDNVTKGGQKPGTSFVPAGILDADGKDFKKKDYVPATADVENAKKLLADAGFPDGKGFPTIELMYNSGQAHQDIATAVQSMLKQNLGINVTLKNVERKVQLTETVPDANGNVTYPDISRNGWIADYSDPMTFLDMFTSASGNNTAGYKNPDYDKLIASAKGENDPAKRMSLLHQAEDILMNDMPVIPIYEYTNVVCMKPYIKDVYLSPLGFVYFNNASVASH